MRALIENIWRGLLVKSIPRKYFQKIITESCNFRLKKYIKRRDCKFMLAFYFILQVDKVLENYPQKSLLLEIEMWLRKQKKCGEIVEILTCLRIFNYIGL